ncbi:NUDIX domain-containing protein [Neorhizobium sp. T786]|uniref:NUDIX domain-containing protein n=1 Tax=Pseudorhizobium xiangyangii TaxID=2883104 RepID=UPI001CFFFC7E|nr:NUDIX domain-containing protein [Neorhizobium xiangyangii]MCB5203307.1 NUDIX domain-containing protein [Neorhizobium xiangyangii]
MLDIDTSEAERVRLISRARLWKGFVHLQKLVFEQRMPDGSMVTLDREVHDHGTAAAILLHDPKEGSVVLVRQFRPGAFVNGDPAFMLEVPAGLIDEDELPADAVIREAMEETGFEIDEARYLFDMYASPGTLTEKVALFVASVSADRRPGTGGGLAGEGEDIEVVTMGLDDAYAMIRTGEINDAKTIVLLQWAMLNRDSLSG